MAIAQQTFLQDLQSTTGATFYNINTVTTSWNDGEDDDASFEVGEEVTNKLSSDINLAEALFSLQRENSLTTQDTVVSQQTNISLDNDDDDSTRSSGTVGDIPGPSYDVKEELRSKIQTRRLSQGVGELKVTFEAPKTYPLSKEERKKVELRKRRNRNSANKSRERRKQYEDELIERVKKLEEENDNYEKEIKLQNSRKRTLQTFLDLHMKTCRLTTINTANSVSFRSQRSVLDSTNTFGINTQH